MPRALAAAFLCLTLFAAACVRTEPVYDVHDATLPAQAQGLPAAAIGAKITAGVARARWRLDQAGPGRLRATHDGGKHAATVNVTWTERAYSITLVSATNLNEQGGQIHRAYNAWVRDLEREINDAFYLDNQQTGAAAPPTAVATLSGAAPSAAASFGDSVPFACPPPGTEIEFQSAGKRVFGVGDGLYCPYESAGQRQLATNFGVHGRDAAQALTRLWPLKLGNQVSVATKSGQGYLQERYRVTRHAPVTVKAGTFDAFIIDWSGNSSGGGNVYSETGSFWYAPELGYVVKVRHQLTGGTYPRLVDDEAVRIARP